MTTPDFHIFNRVYSRHSPAYESGQTGLFDLNYWGILDVHGEQAKTFLQGQITCDMQEITPQQMRPGAFCNLEGRIIACVDVVETGGIQLILPLDLINKLKQSLDKAALFSRVQLSLSSDWKLFGLYTTDDSMPLYTVQAIEQGFIYCIAPNTYHLLIKPAQAESMKQAYQKKNAYFSAFDWHTLRLTQGAFEIYPETSGHFLPHKLGLQNSPCISFNKGCYKGQEIIARMHYRATIKHKLYHFAYPCTQPLTPGMTLFSKNGQELGALIDFTPIQNDTYYLTASLNDDYQGLSL